MKTDGKSLNITAEKILKIREILPEAFVEDKIDWEKLKAALGENINFSNERYVLNWAGKSEAFRVLQSQTFKTLIPAKDESVNFDETGHIFIEGENLEVLKILQKSYFNKIKMIYIDPPYNTGNDSFIYHDKFAESKEEYLKRIGTRDENGCFINEGLFRKNSKENGQYHSNWLNMMYPRLFLARTLLRDDGIIFVSIDDNEVHNLRLMMNEIFGEENFIGSLIWKSRQIVDSRNQRGLSSDHEYIFIYARNQDVRLRGKEIDLGKYSNPDNDHRGAWMSNSILGLATKSQRPNLHYEFKNPETGISYAPQPESGWRYSEKTMLQKLGEKRIIFPKGGEGRPREKKFLSELNNEFTGFSSILSTDLGYTLNGTRELREILGDNYFPFPKPTILIKELVRQGSVDDCIVADFFAGSSTTAHAVLDLNKEDGGNRKFICVQLPEPCDIKSEAYKAGYKTIADIAKERIRRVIEKIKQADSSKLDFEKNGQDLGFKVFKLSDSNFRQWQSNIATAEDLEKQMEVFVDPISKTAVYENMVYELLLKSGKDLNSGIEHKDGYFLINGSEIVMLLETVEQTMIDNIIALKPVKVIALDKLFEGNDQLKTSSCLQMKDAKIDFETI